MTVDILAKETSIFGHILFLLVLKAPIALITSVLSLVQLILGFLFITLWDTLIFLANVVLPKRKKGTVVPDGQPGSGGLWPGYQTPTSTDSRAPCPYLNALANHGILPHNGRNISMKMLRETIGTTLNFSPSMTLQTTKGVESLFKKSVIDLGDLCEHRVIEHDGSLLRHDAYFQPNQTTPSKDLIDRLLSSASIPPSSIHPKGAITQSDIANLLSKRLAESKRDNPSWNGLSLVQWVFLGNNSALLLDTADGDVEALRTILLEERFPDGWETANRHRFGYTVLEFQLRSLQIYLGIRNL